MGKNKILMVILAGSSLGACVGNSSSSSNMTSSQGSELNDTAVTSPLCGSISQISPNESGQEYLVGLTLTNISESPVDMTQQVISFNARTSNTTPSPIWQRPIHADSDNGIDSLIISGTPDTTGNISLNLTPEYPSLSNGLLQPGASIAYNMKKPIAIDFQYSGQWETPYMFDVAYANTTLLANGLPIGIVNASVQFLTLPPNAMVSVVGGVAELKTVTLENNGTSSTLVNQISINDAKSNSPDSYYSIVNDHCSGLALNAGTACSFDIVLNNDSTVRNLSDYIDVNYETGCGSSSDVISTTFTGSVTPAVIPTPTPSVTPTASPKPTPTMSPRPTPSPSVTPPPAIPKKIIFSSKFDDNGVTGQLGGGISFADTLCQGAGYKLTHDNTAIFKALIVDGKTRVACTSSNCKEKGAKEHIDWVLAPNTKYYDSQSDSSPRIQTDSMGLIALSRAYSKDNGYDWTGLNADWTTGNTCNQWSVGVSSQKGTAGNPLSNKNSDIYSAVSNNCGTASGLYCVQQ